MPTTSPPLIFIRLLLVLLVATSSALANNFVDASSRIDAIIRIDLKKHGLQPNPATNDGRKVTGWLPELRFAKGINPVVQVVEDGTNEVLYTIRPKGNRFQPRVYSKGKHTVKIGLQKPDSKILKGLNPKVKSSAGHLAIEDLS